MPHLIDKFDAVVFGGGIFGAYTALYLSRQGLRVCLLEKDERLFGRASIVNQARLHGGYHYPRSIATARSSDENKARFTAEHQAFINFSFEQYYAIDRYASLTDAAQFERFCRYLNIPCQRVESHPLISKRRLEALYMTEEYSFDPVLIAHYYTNLLSSSPNVEIRCSAVLESSRAEAGEWYISYQQSGVQRQIKSPLVINATYAATNIINEQFGLPDIDLQYEISEMLLLSAPELGDMGLTVMDGPFASLMPYGQTGLYSLSSVAYTHHAVAYDRLPEFSCQQHQLDCRSTSLGNCDFCPSRPITASARMLAQIRQYFKAAVPLQFYSSMYTVKAKLQANYIDDGRPTEIRCLQQSPAFYCIFAGKINSIYQIEKVFS